MPQHSVTYITATHAARLVTRQLTVPKGLFTASSTCVSVSPCKIYYAPRLPVLFSFNSWIALWRNAYRAECGCFQGKGHHKEKDLLKNQAQLLFRSSLPRVGALCWWLHTASHTPSGLAFALMPSSSTHPALQLAPPFSSPAVWPVAPS